MIYIYTGTPGSGKSFHQARNIFWRLRFGYPVIANYYINTAKIKKARGEFIQIDNWELTPDFLKEFSRNYFKDHKFKEGTIQLYIDECQLIFNCRDWGKKDRAGWIEFFTQHRKYGYDVFLVAQFDAMIDKQLRSLIEYQIIHRKISNFGWKGKLLSMAMGGNVVCAVKIWYPMKERVSADFFRIKKSIMALYDSYLDFNENTSLAEVLEENGDNIEDLGSGISWKPAEVN